MLGLLELQSGTILMERTWRPKAIHSKTLRLCPGTLNSLTRTEWTKAMYLPHSIREVDWLRHPAKSGTPLRLLIPVTPTRNYPAGECPKEVNKSQCIQIVWLSQQLSKTLHGSHTSAILLLFYVYGCCPCTYMPVHHHMHAVPAHIRRGRKPPPPELELIIVGNCHVGADS